MADMDDYHFGTVGEFVLLFCILFTLPITAIILLALGPAITGNLGLDVSSPQWWQFFTSSYTQQDASQLAASLAIYLPLAILQAMLARHAGKPQTYGLLALLALAAAPIASGATTLLLYTYAFNTALGTVTGSSGIISAFLGFTPALLALAYTRATRARLSVKTTLGIPILYATAFASLAYAQYLGTLQVWAIIALFLLLLLYSRKELSSLARQLAGSSNPKTISLASALLAGLFIATPAILFPPTESGPATFTDFATHAALYAIGAFTAYFALYLPSTTEEDDLEIEREAKRETREAQEQAEKEGAPTSQEQAPELLEAE
jgi:hypothetical protein